MNVQVITPRGTRVRYENVVISWSSGVLAIYRGSKTADIIADNFEAAFSPEARWEVFKV